MKKDEAEPKQRREYAKLPVAENTGNAVWKCSPRREPKALRVAEFCILEDARVKVMRRLVLKQTYEALAHALQGLESVRLIPRDDPVLSELKEDIRRTIQEVEPESELSTAA